MIEINSVSKTFNAGKSHIQALEGVNLKIKKGEIVVIVGPSGSGKSTLLHLIAKLDQATEGEIVQKSKKHGFVFQEFHLNPLLNVKENILLPTYFQKSKSAEKYAQQLLKEVGLSEKTHAKPSELSGGQKQRVAIARALITKPQLILADEPTGNLDQTTGRTIIKLLKDLQKKHGITLIIATHDPQIAKIANRIIKIKDGKIVK